MPIWRSLGREWRLLRGRPWDAAMLSWVPALAVALICAIFVSGLPRGLPMAVWNEDPGPLSRQLIRLLQAAPGLRLEAPVQDAAQAQWALQSMQVYAVLHIPPDFQRELKQGRSVRVQLLHNAQMASHSGLIQRDVRQAVGVLNAAIQMQASAKRGEPGQALAARREPIQLVLQSLFNPATNYEAFLALALLPALLHVLGMTAGAWSVGRELRDRSLGRWLHAACAAPAEAEKAAVKATAAEAAALPGWPAIAAALLGKLLSAWLSLSALGLAGMLYLTQVRGWQAAGSLGWVVLALFGLMAASLALGGLLAALSRNLRVALSLSGLLAAPAFAFSGVGFPLLAMTPGAQAWALAMPYTHYIRLQIEQMQMGASLSQSLPVLAGLWLGGGLSLLLAAMALRAALARPQCWGQR